MLVGREVEIEPEHAFVRGENRGNLGRIDVGPEFTVLLQVPRPWPHKIRGFYRTALAQLVRTALSVGHGRLSLA